MTKQSASSQKQMSLLHASPEEIEHSLKVSSCHGKPELDFLDLTPIY